MGHLGWEELSPGPGGELGLLGHVLQECELEVGCCRSWNWDLKSGSGAHLPQLPLWLKMADAAQ